MKRKRYRLKKEPVIRLVFGLVVFIIVVSICVNYYNGRYVRKLKKIGYTDTEIKTLKTKKVNLGLVSKYNYIEALTTIVGNKDYKEENLKKYLNLYQPKNDIDTVIYIVNKNLDYEYSEKLASLIHAEYFIDSKLDRYMKYDKSKNVNDIIATVNTNTDFEHYDNTSKADITKGKLMLVNKYNYLDDSYECSDLVKVSNEYANLNGNMLNSEAYSAIKELIDDALKEDYHIRINYSYRSYETQEDIYNGYKNSKGEEYADGISIRPGFSEHQTGYAVDVGVQSKYSKGAFKSSNEYKWMKENAYKYGFILRYPEGKENLTGCNSEPWHYRYVGKDVATFIHENNITFDEYYAYYIENK